MSPELSPELKQIHKLCDSAQTELKDLQTLVEDLRAKPYNAKEIEHKTALFLRHISGVRRIQQSRDNTLVI